MGTEALSTEELGVASGLAARPQSGTTVAATFDTSGCVYGVGDRGHDKDVGYKTWGNLSPFVQGYVEAMFASLFDPKNRGWEYSPAHNGYIHPNHKHGPNHRGLMAGWDQYPSEVSAEDAWDIDHYANNPTFSDLAPETLARIMEDCERFADLHGNATTAQTAAIFWRNRQAGGYPSFPPLTPFLGDDGKVRFQ